jgi:hypothetical protein
VSTTLSNRSVTRTLSCYWSDVVDTLARPDRSWQWVDCDLPPKVQHRLKDAKLIVRDESGDRWQTTQRLWSYVEQKSDIPNPGCRLGDRLDGGESGRYRENE